MSSPVPPSEQEQVLVAVVRTGGIAGVRRQWQVDPPHDELPRWIALIERCPWEETPDDGGVADRFVWTIRVRTPDVERERDVRDGDLAGPWRALVDAVREYGAADARGR